MKQIGTIGLMLLLLLPAASLNAVPVPGLDYGLDSWSEPGQDARFEAVMSALRSGNLDLAQQRLNPLRESYPEHPGTLELQGTLLLAADRPADAESALRRAITRAAGEPTIRAKLAIALLAQGKTEEGRNELDTALRLAPEHSLANTLLGDLAQGEGNRTAAATHYERAIGQASGFSPAHGRLADLWLADHQPQRVIELLDPIKSGTSEAEAYLLLARAHVMADDPDRAERALEAARRLGAPENQLAFYRAVSDRQAGDLAQSTKQLRDLSASQPENAFFRYELALTLLASEDYDEAIEELMRVIELVPSNHWLRLDAAYRLTEQATARFPEQLSTWLSRSALLIEQGHLDQALQVLDEAAIYLPDAPELRFQRALVYQQRGDSAQAEALYTELIDLAATRNVSLNNLAMMLSGMPERLDDALAHAMEAYQGAPDSAAIEGTLGWVLLESDRAREAIVHLERAYDQQAGSPALTCYLGLAYHRLGEQEQARPKLEQCVDAGDDLQLVERARRATGVVAR